MALSLFARKATVRRRTGLAAFVALLVFTNPFLCSEAFRLWEHAPVAIAPLPYHDAAVILTGFTNQKKSPRDRVYTHKGADRVLVPIALYRRGKVGSFVISGGSGSLMQDRETEAANIRTILLDAGIPDSLILVEDKSRNTVENARYIHAVLGSNAGGKRLLLVTSAFHMRRAHGCFTRAGLQTTPFPVDYYTSDRMYHPEALLVPQEEALARWQRLLHEIAGFLVYKAQGYL